MKVITVAGPDKISLNMYITFLRKSLGDKFVIGNLHSLMTLEAVDAYVTSFLERTGGKALFQYYARKKKDPSCLPSRLLECSDAVIWFNLYSTDTIIIKDTVEFEKTFSSMWKKNVDQLNKLQL